MRRRQDPLLADYRASARELAIVMDGDLSGTILVRNINQILEVIRLYDRAVFFGNLRQERDGRVPLRKRVRLRDKYGLT